MRKSLSKGGRSSFVYKKAPLPKETKVIDLISEDEDCVSVIEARAPDVSSTAPPLQSYRDQGSSASSSITEESVLCSCVESVSSAYRDHLVEVLAAVLSSTTYSRLLDPYEIELLKGFLSLSARAQGIYARLFQRQGETNGISLDESPPF